VPQDFRVRVEEITDEVKDLHPLLKAVLPRLPRIQHVEYTHGQNEMGADFALSRLDDTIQDIEYIGVIAKAQKIGQDFSEIQRQIEECALPRTFLGGKHKVRISECWVVSTQTISKNAQDKIHEFYKNRKVTFIDGPKLARWVEAHAPAYWGLVDSTIGEYLATFSAYHHQQDQRFALLPHAEPGFYIQQDVTRYESSRYAQQKSRRHGEVVSISSELLNKRALLVEGGMGSGKTKLARHLAVSFANPEKYGDHKSIPVWVPYSALVSKHAGSIANAVNDRVPADVRAAVEADEGQYLVFVDGVDEVDADPNERTAALVKIADEAANSRFRVLITSRYLGASDDGTDLQRKFYRYRVAPLTTGRVLEFLKKLCSKLSSSSRIAEDLKKSPLFKSLPKSPIAAILLAKLLNERAKELPSNLTELYAKYTELMLGRWDIDKGLASQKEYEALDRILTDIARHMMQNGLMTIPLAEARVFFSKYLAERNLGLDAAKLFESMRERCEMVVIDDQNSTFWFRHRTFAEYLVGKSFASQRDAVIDARAFDLYWINSYFFYVGSLRDCPETLALLGTLSFRDMGARWMKAFHLAEFMLAGYASNYSVIEDGIRRAARDAVELYKDILASRQLVPVHRSPLARIPEMHLLWVFQFAFRNSYSYDFFKRAIETAGLHIAGSEGIPKEDKAYALFFLNVAYIDLGAPGAFDFMLKGLGDNLPIQVALALRHESDHMKNATALLRKQQRHLRKTMRDNRPLHEKIKDMYEAPRPALPEKATETERAPTVKKGSG
jgi:hypothetical protein